MKAGADEAGALLDLLQGKLVTYHQDLARDGAIYSRFDQSICVAGEESLIWIENVLDVSEHVDGLHAIVFDLDDTLYSEKDYVRSGYHQISRLFLGHEQEVYDQLWHAFLQKQNAIDEMLWQQGVYSDEMKEKCLRIYRYQQPDIKLYEGIEQMLRDFRQKGYKLGLLTDGRVEGQYAKIRALGLEPLFDEIIVTDELAGNGDVAAFRKPNAICFEIMQRRLGVLFEQIAYVGDNINKDFHAPRMLGMRGIYFKNEDVLY